MKKINIFSLVTGILGALCLLVAAIPIILVLTNFGGANDIGVIGGADTPTAIHVAYVVMDGWPVLALWLGVPLILTSLFTAIFKKTTENCLTIKTSVTAILISALCAVTVYCAGTVYKLIKFNSIDARPVAFPCCLVAGIIAIVGLIVLLALYIFKFRKAKPSAKGVIIDLLTVAVYAPGRHFAFGKFVNILSWAVNVILS